MPDSINRIIKAARECFRQHGYNTANIAMISRHAKISRVTIHKHFTNKEALFRAVVSDYLDKTAMTIENYQLSNQSFWPATKALLREKCERVFEEVSNHLIKPDLAQAGEQYCQDLIEQRRLQTIKAIADKAQQAVEANELSLVKVSMTSLEFAQTLHQAAENFLMSGSKSSTEASFIRLLNVFVAATESKA
ncbi:TetR/AcrR family transcriptional regulator [Thalassotalea aquiviva]|uniref:TetR/AcrR family transcriptional regulator n=1 Tax=Thalassotalea aquiviva TaxID=3242415 RepID=UPI00352B511D